MDYKDLSTGNGQAPEGLPYPPPPPLKRRISPILAFVIGVVSALIFFGFISIIAASVSFTNTSHFRSYGYIPADVAMPIEVTTAISGSTVFNTHELNQFHVDLRNGSVEINWHDGDFISVMGSGFSHDFDSITGRLDIRGTNAGLITIHLPMFNAHNNFFDDSSINVRNGSININGGGQIINFNDLNLEVRNGNITLQDVWVHGHFGAYTRNGNILLENVFYNNVTVLNARNGSVITR